METFCVGGILRLTEEVTRQLGFGGWEEGRGEGRKEGSEGGRQEGERMLERVWEEGFRWVCKLLFL